MGIIKNIINTRELNHTATTLESEGLLFGEVRPLFKLTISGKMKLSYEPLNAYIKKNKLDKESLRALLAGQDYLADVQNIIKKVESLH